MTFKNKKVFSGIIILLLIAAVVIYKNNRGNTINPQEIAKFEKRPEGFFEFLKQTTIRIGETESGYLPNYRYTELKNFQSRKSAYQSSFSDTLTWISRGPYNVGGRTKCILVDPDDPNTDTWYVGTAGGGIWKTTDAGVNWTDMTPELPNLSTVSLAMAPSNHDVIYAGTGEGYGGIGMITGDAIYKSTDRGETWSLINSTSNNQDFYYVNKIWVDPEDENKLLVATNTGIFKTNDGGESWVSVYSANFRVQDLQQNPLNPNVLYAGVNSFGVLKSVDRGLSWFPVNTGLGGLSRVSLAVSPVDTSYIFASVETPESEMDVYISTNSGQSWRQHADLDETFINFHNAQGWYNNAIAADPYIKAKAYVGGVYLGSVEFLDSIFLGDPEVLRVDTSNTEEYMGFINFGGSFLGGGMSTGLEENASVTKSDFTSVKIYFGPGRSQKAHRFLVPLVDSTGLSQGSGVAKAGYSYADYVDVPFEAWDITNNRQLAISFRDQERDGAFNLIERDPNDEVPGREYIFIHSLDYDSESPNSSVTVNGGHYQKMLYFFWPTLAVGGEWDKDNLPVSEISVEYGSLTKQEMTTTVIADGTLNKNLHVDHHQIVIIPGAFSTSKYKIIDANDGGVGISRNGGRFWSQLTNGFYTTQFYGMAKQTGQGVFIGGMQDNGTWISPSGFVADDKVEYENQLGGDGFEVLWHPDDSKKIIGSIYNNIFYSTNDGGKTWLQSDYGINQDGPFISKLSHSRENPELIFAVGAKGVYRHTQFGKSPLYWDLIAIENGFTIGGVASSSLDVQVSKADPSIVWAGSGMYGDPDLSIFLSEDYGLTFNPVSDYSLEEMGYISGMETHPTDPNTAYLLFSYKGYPKILRTTDKGNSWEDISGFQDNESSSNGFPDVRVLSLLVMPHDTDVIWAGTEIGIVESVDNGASWHLLESDFPNVAVYQMDYQDNQILLATHGRGMWTAGSISAGVSGKLIRTNLNVYPNPAYADVTLKLNNNETGKARVRILSLDGRVFMDESYELSAPNETLSFNVNSLNAGLYLVEANYGSTISSTQLMIY